MSDELAIRFSVRGTLEPSLLYWEVANFNKSDLTFIGAI